MNPIEERLKSLALAAPSDALRGRLLKATERERPSEWKRLQHTMEWCATLLIAVYGWSMWFESGSEEIRQGLRTTTYAEQLAHVEQQVAETLAEATEALVRDYIVAQNMEAYRRPFVVETVGLTMSLSEVN
ncbi:MAG: hypothetical protein JNK74_23900 [Candidatus Hydrogenedentes bacterium]|nr:hypothetical protein [Candidatus Hydrogenedentota bacterium]